MTGWQCLCMSAICNIDLWTVHASWVTKLSATKTRWWISGFIISMNNCERSEKKCLCMKLNIVWRLHTISKTSDFTAFSRLSLKSMTEDTVWTSQEGWSQFCVLTVILITVKKKWRHAAFLCISPDSVMLANVLMRRYKPTICGGMMANRILFSTLSNSSFKRAKLSPSLNDTDSLLSLLLLYFDLIAIVIF